MVTASDLGGVGHARHAAVGADVGGHALERHHRGGAGGLGQPGLLGGDHVHDHTALEHLGEPGLDAEGAFFLHGSMVPGGPMHARPHKGGLS
jgi:hypothetical protein